MWHVLWGDGAGVFTWKMGERVDLTCSSGGVTC